MRSGWWLVFFGVLACVPAVGTVGAVLGKRADGRLFVRQVPKGLGADLAGVREGDEILSIDGVEAENLSDDEVRLMLRGEVGAQVPLTLIRRGQVVRVTVIRTEAVPLEPRVSAAP